MIDIQRAERRIVIGKVDADAVDAVVLDLNEGIVSEALESHWASRCMAGTAGNGPDHGLPVGVTRQEGEAASRSLEGRLEAVVIGIAHVLVNGVGADGIGIR